MWIFSTEGFFSVVRKDGKVHLRARRREDLENIQIHCPTLPLGSPIHEGDGDYPFRILLTPKGWGRVAAWLAETALEYDNFKDAVKELDPERARLYLSVWSLMSTLGTGYPWIPEPGQLGLPLGSWLQDPSEDHEEALLYCDGADGALGPFCPSCGFAVEDHVAAEKPEEPQE